MTDLDLNDAFEQEGLIQSIFSELGPILLRAKKLSRVKDKISDQDKIAQEQPGRENYFKPISDLTAGRVLCNVKEIQQMIDVVKQVVRERGGQVYVKGETPDQPYGSFMKNKRYEDIMQFVYVHLDEIGMPLELQIGHEFAALTFKNDSALRDDKTCGKIDLWSQGFYGDVKNYILMQANNEPLPSKDQLFEKAKAIHEGKDLGELQAILNKL